MIFKKFSVRKNEPYDFQDLTETLQILKCGA